MPNSLYNSLPNSLANSLLIGLRTTAVSLVLLGTLYPIGMTGLCGLLFPNKARGSVVTDDKERPVGSALLGQPFRHPAYVQPRPSAAGAGHDPTASSGSNLGPTSRRLRERVQKELIRLRAENPEAPAQVPADLVTASASGLDPHLSPAAVRWQVARVARARGVTQERIQTLIAEHVEGRELGLLGEPRVNVLLLNLALDQRFGRPMAPGS